MKKLLQLWTLFLVFLIPAISMASRVPTDYFKNNYVSENGFKLSLTTSTWVKAKSKEDNNTEVIFQLNLPKNEALFTIRTDKQEKQQTLDEYIKKWAPQFSQFGLDILSYKYFNLNAGVKGFLVDLVNPTSQKQVRQVIFFRDKFAVILTCSDSKTNFEKTLPQCNNLIRGFSWIQESNNTSPIYN